MLFIMYCYICIILTFYISIFIIKNSVCNCYCIKYTIIFKIENNSNSAIHSQLFV